MLHELRAVLDQMAQLGDTLARLDRHEFCQQLGCCVARQKLLVASVERHVHFSDDLSLRPELEAFRDAQRILLRRIVRRYGHMGSAACLS